MHVAFPGVSSYRPSGLTGMLLIPVLLASAGTASAQLSPVMQGDVAATVGWLGVNRGADYPGSGTSWADSLFGAAAAGWYWTDRHKTEIEFGAATTATAYVTQPVVIQGRSSYGFIESAVTRRTIGVGQHYQFFRNAWFHPFVGAGAQIAWQRVTDRASPVFAYDQTSRTGRIVEPERTDGPQTDIRVRPYVMTGFKAYMTQRTFFRGDLRTSFGRRADDLSVRFGFGVDF